MIRYALKCSQNHRFESWFQSASAFDALARSGHLSCAVCGDPHVTKELMAPRVVAARDKARPTPAPKQNETPAPTASQGITEPQPTLTNAPQAALAAFRKHVEENATYVGKDFATKARDMHLGDAPDAPIYGEANAEEAKALIEDGIPVAPLPFRPTAKSN